uniref:Uncharacterized protein n=1 Tax=viral metagenome TaxID=1070528 RepID=A0A6M3L397_9ZZZZ
MLYDYLCTCGKTQEAFRPYAKRHDPLPCSCGQLAHYQFPVEAIQGFQPFEGYFDEALNCDIKGRRHRQQVMKMLHVQEAGDAVHGARNFDAKAPYHVKPLPLQGVEPVSPELKQIATEKALSEEWNVEKQQDETWKPVHL